MAKNTGAVCRRPSSRKPRAVPSEAVKPNLSICDDPPLCWYATSISWMFFCVKLEPEVRAEPANSSFPYCGGWLRAKDRASGGVSGSDRARRSGPRMTVVPWGTKSPLLEDSDGRMRSTANTEISTLPLRLVLPLLTTNLTKQKEVEVPWWSSSTRRWWNQTH